MLTPALLPALAVGSVAVVTCVLAVVWARALPRLRRPIVVLVLLFGLAPVLGRTVLGPESVNPRHMNFLHEDITFGVLDRITQPWSSSQQSRWMVGTSTLDRGFAGQVAANRLLHGLTLATLLVLLRGFFASWWPALWVVALGGLGALPLSVASSETWTPVIWLASSLAAVGLVTARHAQLAKWSRVLGAVLVMLLGGWLSSRKELALLWVLTACAAWWPLLVSEARRERLSTWAAGVLRRPTRAPLVALLLLVLLAVIQGRFFPFATPGLADSIHAQTGVEIPHLWLRAALAALPTDVSFLLLPSTLATTTPLAFVVLLLVGCWHIATRRAGGLWLLVGVGTIFKVYWAIGHGYHFEVQRYLSNLLVPLLCIAALGLHGLIPVISALRADSRYWRGVLAVCVLLSLVDARYGMVAPSWSAWPSSVSVDRNHQRNARFLASAAQRWPSCAFVTRADDSVGAASRVTRESLVIWGAKWPVLRVQPTTTAGHTKAPASGQAAARDAELSAALTSLSPQPPCVLALTSLACALYGSAGCGALGEGAPLHEERHRNRPYRHAHFGVAEGAWLTFAVHPLRRGLRPSALRTAMKIPSEPKREGAAQR